MTENQAAAYEASSTVPRCRVCGVVLPGVGFHSCGGSPTVPQGGEGVCALSCGCVFYGGAWTYCGAHGGGATTSLPQARVPTCYGSCGDLGWTVTTMGRVTHKQHCERRTEPWCQAHPGGCPVECEPPCWREWRNAR